MADIFISYSQKDPEPTKALAADLEARGYTTWWDTSLLPGERFPDKIRQELEAAKAVVVIWSENAAKSEWVYAEAQRAQALSKLIMVHVAGFDLRKVPMPFGARHIEPAANRQKLYEALSTLGLKPPSRGAQKEQVRQDAKAPPHQDPVRSEVNMETRAKQPQARCDTVTQHVTRNAEQGDDDEKLNLAFALGHAIGFAILIAAHLSKEVPDVFGIHPIFWTVVWLPIVCLSHWLASTIEKKREGLSVLLRCGIPPLVLGITHHAYSLEFGLLGGVVLGLAIWGLSTVVGVVTVFIQATISYLFFE